MACEVVVRKWKLLFYVYFGGCSVTTTVTAAS